MKSDEGEVTLEDHNVYLLQGKTLFTWMKVDLGNGLIMPGGAVVDSGSAFSFFKS